MKTRSMIIPSIVFVNIFFAFIFFISLFKGIHLYNLRITNIEIKHLFVKIHNKIILKANYIKIIPQQEVSRDVFSLHKKIIFISKTATAFEELTIRNLTYKDIKVPLIRYKKNKLIINSNLIKIKGGFTLSKHHTVLKNISIDFNRYHITDLNGKITFFPQKVNLKASFKLNNSPSNINADIIKNTVQYIFYIKNIKEQILNYFIKAKELHSKGYYNLTNGYYTVKAKALKTYIKKGNLNIYLKKPYIKKLTPKKVSFCFESAYIPKTDLIRKIYLKNTKGSLFFEPFMLIIPKSDFVSLNYDGYKIKSYKNSLIYENPENFNFTSSKLNIKKEDLAINTNNVYAFKFDNYFYIQTKNNRLKKVLLNLYAKLFYIYNRYIEIPYLKGSYKQIPFRAFNFVYNMDTKKGVVTKGYIKGFCLEPVMFDLDNKIKIFTKSDNIKLNSSLKSILKTFDISLPNIYQIKGKNRLSLLFVKKETPHWELNITSYDGEMFYEDNQFFYSLIKGEVKDFNYKTRIKSFYFPAKFFTILSDLDIKGNTKRVKIKAKIKKFDILKFFKMRNYKEDIKLNLNSKVIKLINSQITINLQTKILIFKSLKKILKFTPIHPLIKNGQVFVNFSFPMIVEGIIYLTKPLIINHKNPYKIPISIRYTPKKEIYIHNTFLKTKIVKDKIDVNLKNLDINTSALIFIYNQINTLLPKSKGESKTTLFIKATNTNFIYENHKFLSQKASISYTKNLKIYSKYKDSYLTGWSEGGYLTLVGKNYSKEELVPLLDFFKKFKRINLNFYIIRSPLGLINGSIYIKKGVVSQLKLLNNLIAFINTIPSLLSLQNPGFSAKGYKIKKGEISFFFSNDFLKFDNIFIDGDNLAFKGSGYIDLAKNYINMRITAVLKMKLKKIPIIGQALSYILFKKDGNIHIKITIKGDLNNPKIKY